MRGEGRAGEEGKPSYLVAGGGPLMVGPFG